MATGYGHGPYGHTPYGYPTPPTTRITDVARNPLGSPATGEMLGYVEPPVEEEQLQLDMYRFILREIRNRDFHTLFLKRFLEGPQQVWRTTQSKVFDIKKLWNITDIDDEYLQYIQGLLGWTGKLEKITDRLNYDTLRRLIATSPELWKQRGSEDTLLDILNFITGVRSRIWNWFDYRWILDETELGEEHEGRDPWIIDFPTEGSAEYFSNLRIVDDGNLDHILVKEITKLMRASNERIEISYIDFLDLFTVEGDDSQWVTVLGDPEYSNGMVKMNDDTTVEGIVTLRPDPVWSNYVCFWRIRGTSQYVFPGANKSFFCLFYASADGLSGYFIELNPAESLVAVGKYTGGVFTNYLQQQSKTLYDNVWYGVRVQVSPEGSTNRIKVYIDNNLVLSTTDSTHSEGTIGIAHTIGGTVECDEVEMFQLPLETDLIDINS